MTFIVSVCQRFTLRSDRDSNSGNGFAVYTLSSRTPIRANTLITNILFYSNSAEQFLEQFFSKSKTNTSS